jgi:hypothetical protein
MSSEQFAMTETESWDEAVRLLLGPVMPCDDAERMARRRRQAQQLAAAALRIVEGFPPAGSL